jgi:hypothetical protein
MGGVILLLAIFFATGSEARASHTFTNSTTITLTVDDCDYEVTVGYECSITAGFPSEFGIDSFFETSGTCSSTMSEADLVRALYNMISANPSIYITDCTVTPLPPCIDYGNTWKKYEALCMKKHYSGPYLEYESCWDEGYCITEYDYCFNTWTGKVDFNKYGSTKYGVGDCPEPPVGTGVCFKVSTECD